MTSNSPINSSQNHNSSTESSTYRPSVPISLYRELATELQTTQAQLDSLKEENQQLLQQNQQLRQEIEKVLQSTQQLHEIVISSEGEQWKDTPARPTIELEKGELPSPPQKQESSASNFSEGITPEVEESQSHRPSQAEDTFEISIWFLVVAIVLIVLVFSGLGFIVARPLLSNQNDS
ncbi:MAG: hypothetical protein BRC40_08480 [Cyanobacteria bacterium QH_8_48_120]|jgi:regulator of replication initiation timing|nr:MAG: hypothetical protein BRC38_05365 [Cyanobacteria bacterium QH_6_48_35]PSO67842.1 MAG: hypothetical protein BRC39_00680 [Cyanobacteria bacterium QH_7_48_89]PSO73327.1 MAG: hypothetical protein BRC40_08480 [Cyanobacteria bacterium QH_8_48_120]